MMWRTDPKQKGFLPYGTPVKVKEKPQRGALSKSDKEIRVDFTAYVRQRLIAYPGSTVMELWRAKADAGYDTGTFREFEPLLKECGFDVSNDVVRERPNLKEQGR